MLYVSANPDIFNFSLYFQSAFIITFMATMLFLNKSLSKTYRYAARTCDT